jgi:uncharacterized protein
VTPGTVTFGNGVTVKAAIVDKPEEMSRGLSGRESLPEDEGMLFWMGERRDHGFWMKRTRISLDLLFFDYSKIVGILTLAPMDERSHRIGRPSSSVLEVNGGWAARHGVEVGDSVTISLD